MRILQKAGVPAGAVQDGEHLFHDPHLRERGFIVGVEESGVGVVEYPGLFVRLSDTPGRVDRCHGLGEDNVHVFGTLLGMSEEEIRALEESGILA
jgi:crotonobetainyl-CoA:carnitine CoA-transferase CaiB-like acyl-CoA transferase